jgi:hypothetical protein
LLLCAGRRLRAAHAGRSVCWPSMPFGAEWSIKSAEKRSEWFWQSTSSSRGGKKMWCVPELNDEFIERMEDVLKLYARPFKHSEPVVALDERPVQLLDPERAAIPMRSGAPQHRLRVRASRPGQHLLRRGTAHRRSTDAGHAQSHRRSVRANARTHCQALFVCPNDPSGPRQPEHAHQEVPDRDLRSESGTRPVESFHGAPHTQARQLAEGRRGRSQLGRARVLRHTSNR